MAHLRQDIPVHAGKHIFHVWVEFGDEPEAVISRPIIHMPHVLAEADIHGIDIFPLPHPGIQPVNRESMAEAVEAGVFAFSSFDSGRTSQISWNHLFKVR